MSAGTSGRPWVSRAAAGGFLLAGAGVLVGAFAIPEGGGYQAVGPRAFPLLVGGALTLVAAIGLVQAFRTPSAVGGAARTEWRPVLAILATLAAYVAVLVPAGYWQATTVLFTVVARILGSRRPVRDALIGLVLALATYLLFDRVLGIELPPGIVRLAI